MNIGLYELTRILVWLIGVPVIGYLLWRIVQRIRAINQLDAQLREEEAQQAQNPYAQMAQMWEAQQLLDKAPVPKRRIR